MVIGVKFRQGLRITTLKKSKICNGNSVLLRDFIIRFLGNFPVCGFVPFVFFYEF